MDGHDWYFITHQNVWVCKICATRLEWPTRPTASQVVVVSMPVEDSPLPHSTRLVPMTCAEIQVWHVMSS
jgi:hypothetical protein